MKFAATAASFLVAIAASGPVLADGASDIEACRVNSASPEARIACLEAALLQHDAVSAAQATPAPVAEAPGGASATMEANNAADAEVLELGAEQVRTQEEIDERQKKRQAQKVLAAVTDLARTQTGSYIFFLDNGQIWRQKKSDSNTKTISMRASYEAEVSRGAISGYRLKLTGIRRSFAVERVK